MRNLNGKFALALTAAALMAFGCKQGKEQPADPDQPADPGSTDPAAQATGPVAKVNGKEIDIPHPSDCPPLNLFANSLKLVREQSKVYDA